MSHWSLCYPGKEGIVMGYDGSLKFDTSILTSGFNEGIKKLGSIAKSGMAVVTTAVAGGVAAFGALTKASLDSVASLEQNIGGVETLFKDSADVVIANAKRAYETAGMSANDYMSTVTSFSASLLQSLGGDTVKAASYADRAVTDMSDNANKMGTAMESIQNAYQGFAKQNYTMLDNLKLGYGGTKTEMERLIKDASQLKDVQEKLGITVDESSLSFGNIVNAISVMQEKMGIAGTTAKEAATTIEGSMNSAKAAYDNFLNGTASADEFAESFGIAAEVVVKNLGQIIPRLAATAPVVVEAIYEQFSTAFEENEGKVFETGSQIVMDLITGIIENIPEVADMALSLCDTLLNTLSDSAPQLLNAGKEIFQYILDGISQATKSAPEITKGAADIVSKLMSGIQENAPEMLTVAAELFAAFITGIGEQLPELVPQALQMIATLADTIIANIPTLVDAGLSILSGFIQGIINGLPTLIAEGPRIINDFASAIYSAVGELILTGLKMIVSLVQGLWENKGLLLENAGEIFMAFINIFSLSNLFSLGKNLIQKLIQGIKNLKPNVLKTGEAIVNFLVSGIKNLATHPIATLKEIAMNAMKALKNLDWKTIGSNIVSGIIEGLQKAAGSLMKAAKNMLGSVLEGAKDFLGIHSPSTVFRDVIGKNMALGVGKGFEKNIPITDIENSLNKTIQKAKNKVSSVTTGGTSSTVEKIKRDPTYTSEQTGFDFKEYERIQRKLNKERDNKPIFLGTERIDKPLPKGAVPQL